MSDIVLNIQPSYWNALKFVILTIIVTPLIEFALHRFIDTLATYKVLRGKKLSLSDSRLGLFSLHSSYWGPRRNKLLLLLITLPVLSAELLFEFSFSADSVDVASQRRVWLPTPHREAYHFAGDSGDASRRSVNSTSAPQFSLIATQTCIQGQSQMARIGNKRESRGPYVPGFQYRMNDSYVIRKPFMALDNISVVCSASKAIGHVSFVVPEVVLVDSATRAEGLNAQENTSDTRYHYVRNAFAKGGFQLIGFLVSPTIIGDVRANDHVVCVRVRGLGYMCALYIRKRFALAITSLFYGETPEELTLSVVLVATGSPVEGLESRERRIQLITSIADNLLLQSHNIGDSPSQRLISKEKLELVSMLTLVAANEEGVGGPQNKIGVRSIQIDQKQTATMKRMAAIPITFLLSLFVVIVVADGVLSLRIASICRKRHEMLWKASKGSYRVESTIQWLRERLCDDLKADDSFTHIMTSDIAVKMTGNEPQKHVQILP